MALKQFEVIDSIQVFLISFVVSLVYSILKVVFDECTGDTKMKKWINRNNGKIIMSYFFIVLFFMSVRSELIWTNDEVKEIIGVQWTILSVSIAVFLVWHVLFSSYLKSNNPILPENPSFYDMYNHIKNKRDFNYDISIRFSAVVYLTINILLLIFVSTDVFITKNGEELLTQIFVLLSMYFATNTLVALFCDLLKPIIEEKKKFYNLSKVSKEDEDLEDTIEKAMFKINEKIKEIKKDISLDEKTKQEKIKELVNILIERNIVDKK